MFPALKPIYCSFDITIKTSRSLDVRIVTQFHVEPTVKRDKVKKLPKNYRALRHKLYDAVLIESAA
jgi:hypothetical protein